MKSIKELFKVGPGPSSSHTIGPSLACIDFMKKYPKDHYKVSLMGSLALTGKGHLTDYIIKETFLPSTVDIEFLYDVELSEHPNAMKISDGINSITYLSIGGGVIKILGEDLIETKHVYLENNLTEIINKCKKDNIDLFEYVMTYEEIYSYLTDVWNIMKNTINSGLSKEGYLPGGLNVSRRAKTLYENVQNISDDVIKQDILLASYAYSVAEENASAEYIVTSPTCGASGVLPAVLYFLYKNKNVKEELIIKSLAVAGIIGNVIKTNASISGAEAGCQAEIGSACAMASAAYAYILGYGLEQIDNAAEIALEHHLGLTCDPINGLVQIPCIERNAVASSRAINAANLAFIKNKDHKISFDDAVKTMYQTGIDLNKKYRETSLGGLAKLKI